MADRGIPHSGLTVIYQPPRDQEPIADIIFVHGIQGHPYRTWRIEQPSIPTQGPEGKRGSRVISRLGAILKPFRTKAAKAENTTPALIGEDAVADESQDSDVFWPMDLLPAECPDARILTWGYDSMVAKRSGAINKIGIFAHANNFMYALGRYCEPHRPIIFVAHSLGGILVKEMLVNAEVSENPSHSNIIKSTDTVVFMGTPHRGSQDLAGLGEVARKVASLMLMDTNPSVLDSLGLRNDDLVRSNTAFMGLWRKRPFSVKTFQEGSGLTRVDFGLLNKKVVPEISSTLGDPREEAETLLGNHMDICRISSVQDPNFPILAGQLRSICQRLGKRPVALPHGPESQADVERRIHTEHALSVFIQSLSFEDMYLREHTINLPEEGTCTWLMQHSDFQNWLRQDEDLVDCRRGLLWLKGKPGCGKSSLMKATLCCLQLEERLIARFFFDKKSEIELNSSSAGLFRSIIHQLVSHHEGIRQSFLAMYSHQASTVNDRSTIKWTLQDLKSTLQTLVTSSQAKKSQILIFIDAIDECGRTESRDILMYFRDLIERAHSNQVSLRVCVSSRSFLHISVSNCLEIMVDQLNRGDILAYISRRLSMSGLPDDENWRWVKDTISRRSRGVFLWAVLTTNLALDYHDQGEGMEVIHRRLTVVPPQLSELYAEILSDSSYNCFITYRFFQWVILGTTSLRLREWHQILPLIHQQEPPARFLDLLESEGFTKSDAQLEQKIRTISRGLVEVARAPPQWGHQDETNSDAELDSVLGVAGSLDLEMGETRGIQVIHESVRHFFLYQNGFAVLLKSCNSSNASWGALMEDIPSEDSPLKEILIHGHQSLMRTCIDYQQLTDLDSLAHARALAASELLEQKKRKKPSRMRRIRKKKKKIKKNWKARPVSSDWSSSSSSSSSSMLSFSSAGSSIGQSKRVRRALRRRRRRWRQDSADSRSIMSEKYISDIDETHLKAHLKGHPEESTTNNDLASNGATSRKALRRRRWRQDAADSRSIMLERYISEIDETHLKAHLKGHPEESTTNNDPASNGATSAASSIATNASKRTMAQKTFLSLQYYSITQLFVHAKLAEDLGARSETGVSLFEQHWTRIMLLQENYRFPDILEFCIDIDLPSWVMGLLIQRNSYNEKGAVFKAFRRAVNQDSPETVLAIVVEDSKRVGTRVSGLCLLDHISRSGALDLVYAWRDAVSTALKAESIHSDDLELMIKEHQDHTSRGNGKTNQASAALDRELGSFLGYLSSLRQRHGFSLRQYLRARNR